MTIRDVDETTLPAARAFLETHVETSLLLLSNLESLGCKLGPHLYSGNFRVAEEAGRIVAVFCLTRHGTLLVQTGGRTDLATPILEACTREPFRIEGVIGEWEGANSLWRVLRDNPDFRVVHAMRDVLYRLELTAQPAASDSRVRSLDTSDFGQWDAHISAFLASEGIPNSGTLDERKALFESHARSGHWWGAFDGAQLVSTAALNAVYRDTGQIGGVYTHPDYRGRGFARAAMHALMRDSRNEHGLTRLLLFTGESSRAARALYESLNFQLRGSFALLFGSWHAADP